MGGWVFIDQIGALLFLQIDLIVVNLLFGATSAGEYAIVLKWGNLLRTIAGVLGGVLTPIILTYYAKEHTEKLIRVTKSAVKLMGLTMALPIGLSLWVCPANTHGLGRRAICFSCPFNGPPDCASYGQSCSFTSFLNQYRIQPGEDSRNCNPYDWGSVTLPLRLFLRFSAVGDIMGWQQRGRSFSP